MTRPDYSYEEEGNYLFFGDFQPGVVEGIGLGADWNKIAKFQSLLANAIDNGYAVDASLLPDLAQSGGRALIGFRGMGNVGTLAGGTSYWPNLWENNAGPNTGTTSGGTPVEPAASSARVQIRAVMPQAGTLKALAVSWDSNVGYVDGTVSLFVFKNGTSVSGPHTIAVTGLPSNTWYGRVITLTAAAFAEGDWLSIGTGVDTANTAIIDSRFILEVVWSA